MGNSLVKKTINKSSMPICHMAYFHFNDKNGRDCKTFNDGCLKGNLVSAPRTIDKSPARSQIPLYQSICVETVSKST